MDRLRIGLLGAGRMGRNHARVFSTLRYADLVGIYDPVAKASQALAQNYEVRAFDTLDEL
ncbi:MAG: Gfo/Idh/MocA family oxidoreductase, partial [Caldilinea sp.]|nr:Gfo/Idh/MocA family oxidoreductase [Caldilinea sp.]